VYFGDIRQNANTVKEYFVRHGAIFPPEVNPAAYIIDVVSAKDSLDWNQVWLESTEHDNLSKKLDDMVSEAAARSTGANEDPHEFATLLWTQFKLVTHHMNVSLFRNTEYLNNKFAMHISLALLNGFTFWKIGDSLADLQQNLFTVFNFIFVAPGVISQLQPLFIDHRDIFQGREKKSKIYHWAPFLAGLIFSEFPWLCAAVLRLLVLYQRPPYLR
jgi:hypothetical protein